jgi:hypothetical protein
MTHHDLDPDLERLGDALRASTSTDLAREQQAAHTNRPEPGRARPRRPRLLAGGTLGLAGVGAALVLALGGSTAAPAFAVTRQADGSVLVTVNVAQTTQPWVLGADRKLAAMGIDEQIGVPNTQPGPATVSGPVSCTPLGGVNTPAGPPVKVLLGTDGTQVIPSSTTGAGTVHVSSCVYYKSVRFPAAGDDSPSLGSSGTAGNSGS